MTDEAALLAAVIADPDDDTVRLAMADWWDENGQPERAEFCRVQVELARMPEHPPKDICTRKALPANRRCDGCKTCTAWKAKRDALRRRERAILVPMNEQFNRWHAGIGCGLHKWDWSRGFVSSITLAAAAFMQHAEAIFRAQPVTGVALSDKNPGHNQGDYHWIAPDSCWATNEGNRSFVLPFEIMKCHLPGGPYTAHRFQTDAAARTALSRACVSYGRKLAGLPSLAHLTPMLRKPTGPYPSSQTDPETTGFPTYPHPSPHSG